MKEFKNVLSRLPKQEVNLSSEKVELSVAQDLEKLSSEMNEINKKSDSYIKDIKSISKSINTILKDAKKTQSELKKKIEDYISLGAELGLKVKDTKQYKAAQNAYTDFNLIVDELEKYSK